MMIDAQSLKSKLSTLILQYPELADDEELRSDTFDGETDMHATLSRLLDSALEATTMQEALALRMKDLQARKQRYEHKEDVMRSLILSVMDAAQLSKIILPRGHPLKPDHALKTCGY